MRALHLDYQLRRRPSAKAVLLLLAALGLAGSAAWRTEQLRREQAAWDTEQAQVRSRADRTPVPRTAKGEDARAAQEVAAANAVIRRITFPWADMFAAFETAATDEVALIGIEPDTANGVVRVTAETPTPRAMLNYVRRLQGTASLEHVALQKHELQGDDPHRPLRFTLVAKWKLRD
ncbi:MAG TPA: hypothetical protein VF522_05420 [Ramlibacter sp.]|uniref:hypothetical protein n=1 Tax=Ramlibacter sp. TaxID=1917967 RepID=UPI002ED11D97